MNFSKLYFMSALLVCAGNAAGAQSAGQVYQLSGTAQARQQVGDERALHVRDEVFVADTVLTADESTLVVALNDGSSLTLEEGSQLLVSDYVLDPDPSSLLALTRGRLRATVGRAFAGRRNSFQIRTDELVIGVQGTDFSVLALGGLSRVYVYDGLVELVSTDPRFPQAVLLRPGEFTEARAGEPIDPPRRFNDGVTAAAGGYGGSGGQPPYNPRYNYPPPFPNGGIDPCNELGFRSNDYLPDPRRTYIESRIRDGDYEPPYAGGPGYRPGYGPDFGGGAYPGGYYGGPCNRYGTRNPIPEYYDDDRGGGYTPPDNPQPPGRDDDCCGQQEGHPHNPDGTDARFNPPGQTPPDGASNRPRVPGYDRQREDLYSDDPDGG